MKKLFAVIIGIICISSCSTTKEAKSTDSSFSNEDNLARQEEIKNAVESRKFIIKFERLYLNYGGTAELQPRANFIIINGNRAIISAAYLGRQYDIKPIAGINMRGVTKDYELTARVSKGIYEIKTKVSNNAGSLDVYLSIGKDGYCNASLTSIMIDNVSYRGYIEPLKLKEKPADPVQEYDSI